jgi:hypothetical protein
MGKDTRCDAVAELSVANPTPNIDCEHNVFAIGNLRKNSYLAENIMQL